MTPTAAPTAATAVITAALLDAYDRHDLEALRALHDPSARIVQAHGGEDDLDAWLDAFGSVLALLPDLRIRTIAVVADDRTGVAEFRLSGRNSVPFDLDDGDRAVLATDAARLPATGRTVDVPGIVVVRTSEGLVTSEHHHWPRFWLYEALGLVTVTAVPTART